MHTLREVLTVRYGSDREDDGCEQLEDNAHAHTMQSIDS